MRAQATASRAFASDYLSAYCFSTDIVGRAVYVMGDKVGTRYQVSTVDIDDINKMPAVGIIVSKQTSTTCIVQIGGVVRGLHAGLTPARPLLAQPSGLLGQSYVRPAAGQRWLQHMGVALSSTDVLLELQKPVGIRS